MLKGETNVGGQSTRHAARASQAASVLYQAIAKVCNNSTVVADVQRVGDVQVEQQKLLGRYHSVHCPVGAPCVRRCAPFSPVKLSASGDGASAAPGRPQLALNRGLDGHI